MPSFIRCLVRPAVLLLAISAYGFAHADNVDNLVDQYVDSWGPNIGSKVPAFELADSTGVLRDLDSLATPSGLILFFTRSADW